MKVYIYGAFQDGTRPSKICTDVNFGDLTIYRTMKAFLEKKGFKVDWILPDETNKIRAMNPEDRLVIGGGGLIHPSLLNAPCLELCKAKKAVFGLGINWENNTPIMVVRNLCKEASFLRSVPFVMVRDWMTKAVIQADRVRVCPDATLLNWVGEKAPGKEKAVILAPGISPREGEVPISFNQMFRTDGAINITDLSQLCRFGHFRTAAYHGMLLAFTVNASAEVYFHNVKHQAFISSYWDRLDIEKRDEAILVKCLNPKWFKSEVESGLTQLAHFLAR